MRSIKIVDFISHDGQATLSGVSDGFLPSLHKLTYLHILTVVPKFQYWYIHFKQITSQNSGEQVHEPELVIVDKA